MIDITPTTMDHGNINGNIVGNNDFTMKNGDIMGIFSGGKTMPFLPPMTGNGNHTTYKNGDDWGIVNMALSYPH